MSKKIFLLLFVIALTTFTLSSCRKWFDDGPHYSFRSMKNRLQGTWEFIYVSVNDVDSTEVFRQRIGCYMDLEGIVKAEGANLGDVQILDSTKKILVTAKSQFQKQPSDNQGPSVDIYIQFDNGSFNNIYPFGPFAPDIHSTGFTIKRLTKDELWLERTATYFPPAGTVKQTHYFKLKKV